MKLKRWGNAVALSILVILYMDGTQDDYALNEGANCMEAVTYLEELYPERMEQAIFTQCLSRKAWAEKHDVSLKRLKKSQKSV